MTPIHYSHFLLLVLLLLNVWSFFLFFIDKRKAQKRQGRISERTLFLAAFLFGGVGAWLGMILFRHKTKHWRFRIGLPIAALLTFLTLYALLQR